MKKIVLVILITISTLLISGCSQLPKEDISIEQTSSIEENNLVGAKAAELDEDYILEEMLQYGLEDERLALAEYELIINTFDVSTPFTNIIKAEKTHEAAILELYESYNLIVPEFDATKYVVIPTTLQETFEIGVQAEIDNIAMYNKFLEEDIPADVRAVFESLRDASINHLEAFERNASKGSGKNSSN